MKLFGFNVGLSLVAVYDQEILYSEGFGVKDVNTKQAPDIDTIFDIGSITKIFTSALFMVSPFLLLSLPLPLSLSPSFSLSLTLGRISFRG